MWDRWTWVDDSWNNSKLLETDWSFMKLNLVAGLLAINFIFPWLLGLCHHPNWRTHIFQVGVAHQPTNQQWTSAKLWSVRPKVDPIHPAICTRCETSSWDFNPKSPPSLSNDSKSFHGWMVKILGVVLPNFNSVLLTSYFFFLDRNYRNVVLLKIP